MEIISLDHQLYVLMAAVFFVAGIIQGLFGMGLPAIGIALLSVFIPPLEAIGLNIIPIFLIFNYCAFASSTISVVGKWWIFTNF